MNEIINVYTRQIDDISLFEEERIDTLPQNPLPSFQHIFQRLLNRIQLDPGLTAIQYEDIKKYAELKYQKLCKKKGFNVDITNPALVGQVVYVCIMANKLIPPTVQVFASEQQAVNALESFLRDSGITEVSYKALSQNPMILKETSCEGTSIIVTNIRA